MIHPFKKHTISIQNAWNGIRWAISTQPNYQVHLSFSIIALIGAAFFRISYYELITICMLIVIGFTIETINTSIERAADSISLEWREDIKITKDVSAGAMLFFALGAICIAGIIFVPKIVSLLGIW